MRSRQFGTSLCGCGCGRPAPLAIKTDRKRGWKKGEPLGFVHGHSTRDRHAGYVVEERGYTTPCWVWKGGTQGDGYGRRSVAAPDGTRRNVPAHRAYFEEAGGVVPEGMQLDHLCCVPACVNPEHLEAVTPAENVRRSAVTILKREQVVEIKRVLAEMRTARAGRRLPDGFAAELGRRYGVTAGAIQAIRKGQSWSDVA